MEPSLIFFIKMFHTAVVIIVVVYLKQKYTKKFIKIRYKIIET